MRYASNKSAHGSVAFSGGSSGSLFRGMGGLRIAEGIPLRKDGTPDVRFKIFQKMAGTTNQPASCRQDQLADKDLQRAGLEWPSD